MLLLFKLARFDLLQFIELAQIFVSLETQVEDSQIPTKVVTRIDIDLRYHFHFASV